MRVHALQTGSVAVRRRQRKGTGPGPLRLVATLADGEWTDPLPIFAWLIEHPEGLILVDTGETAKTQEDGYFPGWHPYYRRGLKILVDPEEEIGPRIKELGFNPDDVRWVVMTHLHTDHAGGLAHFPESQILVSRSEYETASGLMGRLRGYLPNRWPEWFSPTLFDLDSGPFGPFQASRPLTDAGDVRIISTPGHTGGHVSVVLEGDGCAIFFAGDTSYTEELMLSCAVDGVSPNVPKARQTLEKINQFASETPVVYLPTHDPQAANRLANRQTAIA